MMEANVVLVDTETGTVISPQNVYRVDVADLAREASMSLKDAMEALCNEDRDMLDLVKTTVGWKVS